MYKVLISDSMSDIVQKVLDSNTSEVFESILFLTSVTLDVELLRLTMFDKFFSF